MRLIDDDYRYRPLQRITSSTPDFLDLVLERHLERKIEKIQESAESVTRYGEEGQERQ